MRVQHNIAAMNSYRNYNNNTKSINKNLEKLSSGYKINRAGDDAAGLAISEKMRAQITGLEGAQKNAKDGISLVQTAEGALTEVHSMLNRMYDLAEQSANGTFEGTDREQLQKEVAQLRTEINRIADSSNFNGIKLLDGSMGGVSATKSAALNVQTDANNAIGDGTTAKLKMTGTLATMSSGDLQDGDKLTVSIELDDGSVYSMSYTVAVTAGGTGATLKREDGTTSTVTLAAFSKATSTELASIVKEIYDKSPSLQETFTVTANASDAAFEANVASFNTPALKAINVVGGKRQDSAVVSVTTEGKGAFNTLDISKLKTYKGDGTVREEDAIFTVNGVQFAFVDSAAGANALGSNVNTIETTNTTNPAASDAAAMIKLINHMAGTNIAAQTTAAAKIDMYSQGSSASSGGLTLQIGDTADKWNKMSVSIDDMHASAMGIGGIDISGQNGAAAAMKSIKNAINYVSGARGTLGATQNRLEHTINNLSVMQENLQDAESTIRDTDVASEMMKYTKNSILVQSAQAMLAQANQQPQGVLQLLQ